MFASPASGHNGTMDANSADSDSGTITPTDRNLGSPASDDTVKPRKDSRSPLLSFSKNNVRTSSLPILDVGRQRYWEQAEFSSSPQLSFTRSVPDFEPVFDRYSASEYTHEAAGPTHSPCSSISSIGDYKSILSQASNAESEAYYSCKSTVSAEDEMGDHITELRSSKDHQQNPPLPGPTAYRRRLGRTSSMSSLPFISSPLGLPDSGNSFGYGGAGFAGGSSTPALGNGFGAVGDRRPVPGSSKEPHSKGPVSIHSARRDMNNLAFEPPSPLNAHIVQPHTNQARQPTDPFIDTVTPDVSLSAPSYSARRALAAHQLGPSLTPPFQSFQLTHTTNARPTLPIPPPPLPCISSKLTHTPAARAKLESQKTAREAWIKQTAAEIADLAGAKECAERRWRLTRSEGDRKAWIEAMERFNRGTCLETRQEERRNLFLGEKGMTALRTGEGNVVGDGFAGAGMVGSGTYDGGNQGGGVANGERRLLGYRMAVMERVSAEVKKTEGEERDAREQITRMTDQEKGVMRRQTISRIEATTGRLWGQKPT
ncbi:uncharacterized protein BDR25DRAFT_366772 [Lindgomyces ingoldianus]|uniref:Uncharacterized protein n=1 Tax=Lindgomyces ingoldianus TaxID=673940 RepID=A0ACB6QYS6_9PLEO|nr:uncharacterized protein BDR25DRAFT_366772 [Lindgomyces ingoldianus]KAF2472020.1 hypothetical protein BDR25DRAFT_366772 [Lindgomyces ingoldianus]